MLRETVPTRLPRIAGIRSETGDEGQVWERRHERSQDYTGIWWRMVMAMMVRTTGGLMLAYSALYTAHFIFATPYDAQPIWTVFNIISAVGIVIALAVNCPHAGAGRVWADHGASARRIRPLLCQRRPGHLALPRLGPPACPGGGRIRQRPLGRHLARHRRPNPSRTGHHWMAALVPVKLPYRVLLISWAPEGDGRWSAVARIDV